jgi:hypothetical protein
MLIKGQERECRMKDSGDTWSSESFGDMSIWKRCIS